MGTMAAMAASLAAQRRPLAPPTRRALRLEPRRALCVVLSARGGRVGVALASRAPAAALSSSRWRSAQALGTRLLSGDARDERERQRSEEERTAAVLKRKLARDVEAARNLALHQVVNVPNVITFARILSTPYLAFLIVQGDYKAATGLLAVAGFSDWLDGYIARTYKQVSIVGSVLDPFADKVLVGSLSLSMLWSGLLPWPLVTLIVGRDLLLVGGTFYYRLKTKDATSGFFDTSDSGAFEVKPSMLSKVNTALQLSLFGFALTNAAWQIPGDQALNLLFGVVGTTTFLSGSEYLWSYMHKTGAFKPLRQVVERTKRTLRK